MNRDEIRNILLSHGCTIKPGNDDLMPYVYEAAEALIAAEREACAQVCEAISDDYQMREWFKYAEMKTDAEAGAADCSCAIRKRGAA